ncbi:MAG: type IV pilin N-terminal domain-containing protein [Euryarchaeota archaeon]|nr:type IV pilin N-terminal domain-containing protein [Euryarchaeota archaeon]
MKANQKFVMDEEAVSPVIAVILMVAITVVLAATVFVLVSDLGGDVGQSSPKLQLVQDSTSSATNVIIKVSDATRSAALVDYQIIHTTPDDGIVVYSITTDDNFKLDGTHKETLYSADLTGKADGDRTGSQAADPGAGPTLPPVAYKLTFMDVNDDDQWNVLDTLTLKWDGATDSAAYDDALPKGNHKLEFRHVPTGSISGTLSINA